MAEIQNSEPKSSRLNCQNDACNKPSKRYCSDHKEVLCGGCFTALHVRCKCDEIPDKEDIVECLEKVKFLFTTIDENSNRINARSYIKNFDEEFKMYSQRLENIEKNFDKSIKNRKSFEFCSAMELILQLQKTFIESNLFTEYTKLKELKLVAAGGSLSSQVDANIERSSNEKKLLIFKDKLFKNINDYNIKKVKKQERDIDNCRQIISELENKIEVEKEVNKKLNEKKSELNKELEKERKKVADMEAVEKERKQREQVKYEQKKKDQMDKFIQIYQKNLELKITDVSNLDLTIFMTDIKQKTLFEEVVASKLRLPDLKRVYLDSISGEDSKLASFLENCTPTQMKLFLINWKFVSDTLINAKFYMSSLSKAVSCATREVYIRRFEFCEKDLQQLIKASCKAERIVFRTCSIHCSTPLDFGATTKYNTKYLSFQRCGELKYKELTTDWISEPSTFSNIVNAISNSGLRDSLKKLDIDKNDTLDLAQVKKLIDEEEMENITVVQEGKIPRLD